MTRTDYVFTLASHFGPVAQFFDRPELLAATARGYESRPGFMVLRVSAREVRAAWAEACAPGKHCERYARNLGGCIAGTCNPPKGADGVMASDGSKPE